MIKFVPPRVVNKRNTRFDMAITRGTIFGNPFVAKSKAGRFHYAKNGIIFKIVETSEEAISCYEKWLRGTDFKNFLQTRRNEILNQIPYLDDLVLGCVCKPNPCHGDILVQLFKEHYNLK